MPDCYITHPEWRRIDGMSDQEQQAGQANRKRRRQTNKPDVPDNFQSRTVPTGQERFYKSNEQFHDDWEEEEDKTKIQWMKGKGPEPISGDEERGKGTTWRFEDTQDPRLPVPRIHSALIRSIFGTDTISQDIAHANKSIQKYRWNLKDYYLTLCHKWKIEPVVPDDPSD